MSYRHIPDEVHYHPGTRIPVDEDCPYDPDYDPCAEGTCGHDEHCYECGKPLKCPTDGYCVDCDIRYMASHQLGC